MNKKRVWLVILVIIIALLLIFLGLTIRKMMIISDLENRLGQYLNSNNFYEKISNNQEKSSSVVESYTKGDKSILTFTSKADGSERKLINYFEGEKTNTYIESDGNKIAILDSNGIPSRIQIINPFPYNNDWFGMFLTSALSSVKSVDCNGKDCYVIKNDTLEMYIEKETGLVIKSKNSNSSDTIVEYYYEFGNVLDTDMQEPNISEYTIQE